MAGKNIIVVTDDSFEASVLGSDKLVMLDFWATWCGPCLALGPTMEALADEYDGKVVIAKLNVDENRGTAAKFRITSIPSVLFFKDGGFHRRGPSQGSLPGSDRPPCVNQPSKVCP